MRPWSRRCAVGAIVLTLLVVHVQPAGAGGRTLLGTVDQLLGLGERPFAIAHRGFGDNLGEDPTRPIENTVAAVQAGFSEGASVVEVDVQLTRDGHVVAFHDDFLLPDFTCLNALTMPQLRARVPWVSTLKEILDEARSVNQASGPLRGLVIIELKAAAPLCDPHDSHEHAIVAAVTSVVRGSHMTHQTMLTSFSPALLYLAHKEAADIARILALDPLQFLSAAEVETATGLEVTLIDKQLSLGLQWAEVGVYYRLPGYRDVGEVFRIAALTGVRLVEADERLLRVHGASFVDALHASGFKALGFTARTADDWEFLASLGVDGIYTNDVPFGVAHEAPIP
jgi:glycerophosphoryl diester phosphodiesterase